MTAPLNFTVPCIRQAPAGPVWLVAPTRRAVTLKCESNIHIGIFFDGTFNNRDSDKPKKAHSNIVRLHDAYRDRRESGFYPIYVPGVGTAFPEIGEPAESPVGGAFAIGCEQRVLYGLVSALNVMHYYGQQRTWLFSEAQIKALCSNKAVMADPELVGEDPMRAGSGLRMPMLKAEGGPAQLFGNGIRTDYLRMQAAMLAHRIPQGKPCIKECFIDVFGFSRGAAQARVFCNWLGELLEGGKLAGVPLRLRFLGIFDTVASAGFVSGAVGTVANSTDGHAGWAESENLLIPSFVENCVHMVAMHEMRKNFPLDTVNVEGVLPPNCHEWAYPGSHSDVGGGYEPGELGIGGELKPQEADARKLSQIPLNHMYACAVKAGVPLDRKLAAGREKAYDPFSLAPSVLQAYDDFLTISGTEPRRMQDWLQPYLNWRWQVRLTYTSLSHVRNANVADRDLLLASNRSLIDDAVFLQKAASPSTAHRYLAANESHDKAAAQSAARDSPRAGFVRKRMAIVRERLWQKWAGLAYTQIMPWVMRMDPEAAAVLDKACKAGPVPDKLALFFDGYVHDSLAGFRKSLIELTGYWRYRRGFRGNERVALVHQSAEEKNDTAAA